MMSAAVVSSRSDEYRVRAAECLKRAQETRDFEVKRQYEELAHQWLYLAEQAETATVVEKGQSMGRPHPCLKARQGGDRMWSTARHP
jgi:hypothetical protein